MANVHDILLRPVVTEKSTREVERNTYVFQVGCNANKHEIKHAVESFFGVRVTGVRTLQVRGKARRFGRVQGRRQDWKKAYVTLAEGDSIRFYGDQGAQPGT
jgi:large subunit ribosomal protein L23